MNKLISKPKNMLVEFIVSSRPRRLLGKRFFVFTFVYISGFRSLVFLHFGLARGTVDNEVQLAWVFLLGASGRTGRFFTQLLFHDLISVSFRFLHEFGCLLHGLFCKLMYYFCIVICCIG